MVEAKKSRKSKAASKKSKALKLGVEGKTSSQKAYIEAMQEKHLVFCTGPAGTGKTLLALYCGLSSVCGGKHSKVIIVRPASSSKQQELEELLLSLTGSREAPNETVQSVSIDSIEGLTFKNSFVIFDDAHSASFHDLKLFLTRVGENTKVVLNGDITREQGDRIYLDRVAKRCEQFDFCASIHLGTEDVVRSEMCRKILQVL